MGISFAYFQNYPPYKFKNGAPKHLELPNLIGSKADEYKSKDGRVLVQFHQNKDWSFKFLLKDDGTILDENNGVPPIPQEVYQVDLDGNGQKDFIVLSWDMGIGLGASEGTVDIYLKEKKGKYHLISFETMEWGLEDFIDLNKDGKTEVIMTSFYGGKDHNYFTYDVYEFKNYKLVNADKKYKGFPKFVWYTNKNNDKDTIQLSARERQKHVAEKDASIKYESIY